MPFAPTLNIVMTRYPCYRCEKKHLHEATERKLISVLSDKQKLDWLFGWHRTTTNSIPPDPTEEPPKEPEARRRTADKPEEEPADKPEEELR